VNLHSAVS